MFNRRIFTVCTRLIYLEYKKETENNKEMNKDKGYKIRNIKIKEKKVKK